MSRRVAIVGGGLAGIAAALDCADAGAAVTLLEVRPRLGGAAYSFEREGLRLDNGQHVFLRCCSEYLELLERLGSRALTTIQPRLAIPAIAPGGKTAWLRRSSLPAPAHLAGALARYRHLRPAARARAASAALALGRLDPDDPRVDAQAFGDWLAERRQSPAAIEALWDLVTRPTLNLPAGQASLALAARVFQIGLLNETAAGDIGWARAPLSDIHDGPARSALARAGVDVRLRTKATRVTATDEGEWAIDAPAGTVTADAVIAAVPHDRLADLVPVGAVAAGRLAHLGSSPIVNLHVVYDRRVTARAFAAGVHSPVQWIFDRTHAAGIKRGQYLAISLSAATEELGMSAPALRSRYLVALAELFPAARHARVERFLVTREHAATFRAAPGVGALRPPAATGLPGLAVAGSFTDTGWPATMEGAVRSGHAAAREVLAHLTRRPRAAVAA
ncbi:MAG: FAD-dependent oxidoreductase [Actinobacteria bacterium]|nr:MAG: FAD-dependent oxidoreductase [Actinomycetota bacterium]